MRLRSFIRRVRVSQRFQLPLLDPYKYAPLPSISCIRLLEIAPYQDQSFIRCSLRTFELQDAPPFKALSYTWGDSHVAIPSVSTTASPRIQRGATEHQVDDGELTLPPRYAVVCDGCLIKITKNLRDALRMLANAVKLPHMSRAPKYYWIDALCVDQGNIAERNNQVARMADIFRKAEGVVVWLGKEDKYVDDALQTMRVVSAISASDWANVSYTSFYEPNSAERTHCPNISFHNWLGFMVLINRPWFKRAWVVQEIALANSALVVCGSKVFDWSMLAKTLSFIKISKWYHHLQTAKLKHVKALQQDPGIYRRVLQSKLSVGMSPIYINETRMAISKTNVTMDKDLAATPSLRMLLDKHRYSKSSDPRDKVFAFLGLADRNMSPFRTQPNALAPNYNLSVQEVYTETARVLLTSYNNLSLLSHVEDPSARRTPNLPSWVPDLSAPLDPYPLRFRGPRPRRTSGEVKWRINSSRLNEGLLDVQGYQLDYIDQTSTLRDESSDPSATWASSVKLALSLNDTYPSPSTNNKNPSRVEVLWRTLTTDVYAHTHPAPPDVGALFIDYILNLQIRHRLTPWSSKASFQPHHSPLSESVYPEWRTLFSLETPESPYSLHRYKQRLTDVVESMFNGTYTPIGLAQLQHELDQSGGSKRRLFKTHRGYLGTGPRSLRAGDEVWILNSGDLPFVLRPQQNGCYRLIGEAFVYGAMHGEVLGLGLPEQNITLE